MFKIKRQTKYLKIDRMQSRYAVYRLTYENVEHNVLRASSNRTFFETLASIIAVKSGHCIVF